MTAAERWRESLAQWAIPDAILASAEENPWVFPPELFATPAQIAPSPSHDRAREVLTTGGSVLDVGCGGGVAAFALTPPATSVVGVDQRAEMLAMFRARADELGVACATIEGAWPDVAAQTPPADVVTAHHVVYNVGEIVPFLAELGRHARARVVVELSDSHPLSSMSGAWRHFWGLERPTRPTPEDLVAVLREMGVEARRERWRGPLRSPHDLGHMARLWRVRLCLPASREREVFDFIASSPPDDHRDLSTVWWDAPASPGT